MLCSNCLGNTKAPVRRCLPRRSLESSDLSVIPEAVEVPLLEAKCRWRGIAMQGLPRFVQSCVKRNGWSGRLVPPPRAQVGVLHCDGAPAPINLPHHPGTDTGALALVNIAVDVEARMHHRDVRRQKAHMLSRVLDRNGPLAPCRRRIKSRKPSRVLVHAPLTVTNWASSTSDSTMASGSCRPHA